MPKRYRQLQVKDLPKVPTWRLERDSNPRPSSRTVLHQPMRHHVPRHSMTDALLSALNTCIINSRVALDKLQLVARHDALLILRCSLGPPKLMYLLRRTPCHDHPKLEVYDELLLRGGIEQILIFFLSDDKWTPPSLPIGRGGLGLRGVSSLALFWRL